MLCLCAVCVERALRLFAFFMDQIADGARIFLLGGEPTTPPKTSITLPSPVKP